MIRLIGLTIEKIDGILDNMPSYEGGKWYRYGGWGCRIGLYRIWGPLNER